MTFEEEFEAQFAPRLAHRAGGFRAMFAAARKVRPIVVETGCLRVVGNWTGDGQSTVVLDRFARFHGGTAWAVDISAAACEAARSVTKANIEHGDSVRFLSGFGTPIDLLYLDSLDFDGNKPMASALHHLFELCSAQRWLQSGTVVAVDDMSKRDNKAFGKGMLIFDYMKRIGAQLLIDDYQAAWMMP